MKTTASQNDDILDNSMKTRLVLGYVVIGFSAIFVVLGFIIGVIYADHAKQGTNRTLAFFAILGTIFNLLLVYVILSSIKHKLARRAKTIAALMVVLSIASVTLLSMMSFQ